MTEHTIGTLKELLERRLCAMDALHAKDVAAIQAYFNAVETALKLQAREYERRLEHLNGQQQRIAELQASFVGREIWDRFIETDKDWKFRIEHALASRVTQSMFYSVIVVLVMLAGLVISVLKLS